MVLKVQKKINDNLSKEVKTFLQEGRKPKGFHTKIAFKATKELDSYVYVNLVRYYIKSWDTVEVKSKKAILIYQLAVEAAKEHLGIEEK